MDRKKKAIAFFISTVVTIGVWMAVVGKPHHHCMHHEMCHPTEMTTETPPAAQQ